MAGVKQKAAAGARAARAAKTRARMLDAAYELFASTGYTATTMHAIAARAGVAVQTVYYTFHTKDDLLREVHRRAVLGDEEPLPPAQQHWHKAFSAEPNAERALLCFVRGTSVINARLAPLVPVFHAATEEPIQEIWQHARQLRRTGFRVPLEELAQKAPLRSDLSHERALDILFVVLGPELYRSMTIECGWTAEEFDQWAASLLVEQLLARPGRSSTTQPASQ